MKDKRVLPPTYLLVAIVLSLALHFLLPVYKLVPMPWNLLGILPLAAGIALNLSADQAFHQAQTTVKPFDESAALLTTGVFRTWLAMGERDAALRLAACLFLVVMALLGVLLMPMARRPRCASRAPSGQLSRRMRPRKAPSAALTRSMSSSLNWAIWSTQSLNWNGYRSLTSHSGMHSVMKSMRCSKIRPWGRPSTSRREKPRS